MKQTSFDMKGFKPDISGYLIPESGSTIHFEENDVRADSLQLSHGTSVPGTFTVGGVILGSLNLTLINHPTRTTGQGKPDYTSGKFSGFNWKGSKIALYISVSNGSTTESLFMGNYYVDSHSESGVDIQVQAYDTIKVLDEYQIYEDNLFPIDPNTGLHSNTTSTAALTTICNNRGITFAGWDQQADTFVISDPHNDLMTERQFISYIAQAVGKYAVLKYERVSGNTYQEKLTFCTYNKTSGYYDYDAGATFSHDLRTNNITVTGVKVYTTDNKYTEEKGNTNGYQIVIDSNPFLDYASFRPAANMIYNVFNGLTYRPGTAEIVGTPALEAGDIIKVRTGQETNLRMLVTNITYGTGLTITVTADADPADSDLRITRSQYIKQLAGQNISDELADPDSDLSKAIAGAGGGTVVHFPTTNMLCYEPAHWYAVEAPCRADPYGLSTPHGVFTTYEVNGNSVVATKTTDGYDFNRVTWWGCDVCIPPYDANSSEYFDVTMYLGFLEAYNTAQTNGVYFMAQDPDANMFYYPLAIHARAKYAGSATLLQFETQFLLMPSNYEMGGMMVSGLMIPLPSPQFNMSTGQWVVDPTTPPPGTTYFAPVTYPT